MAKAEIKTKVNDGSVAKFIDGVANADQRADAYRVLEMMQRVTKEPPRMWGTSIIGFGQRTWRSPATGREVDWLKVGFSPRKAALSLYVLHGPGDHEEQLAKLGKHKTGKGCLYIKRLSDVDEKALEKLIANAFKSMK